MEALLSNRDWPEYGSVTIPLPIPPAEYDRCMELLRSIEIGDPLAQDCRVENLTGTPPVLDCLLDQQVNVDELNFLAKRMNGFWRDENAQFSAAAYSLDKKSIRDLINLTFCTENVTVITDFSPGKLGALGKTHYLHINGGSAPASEVDRLNGGKVMRDLIASGKGQITPFGVYYDNGMEFREIYKGRGFPEDEYTYETLCATLNGPGEARTAEDYTILHLPAPDSAIPRALIRGGLDQEDTLRLSLEEEKCPPEVLEAIGSQWTISLDDGVLEELNAMCRAISGLSDEDRKKLGAVIRFAEPKDAAQILRLAENLGMFEFVPEVKTPEEYGTYLLRASDIENDEELCAFFDFEGYGKQQVQLYDGRFNEHGYVALHASITLEELMMDDPSGPGVESVLRKRLAAMSPRKDSPHKGQER